MKRNLSFGGLCAVYIAAFTGLSGGYAKAACLDNLTGRTLYVIMKSVSGTIERSLPSGEQVCKQENPDVRVDVDILSLGGGRFGCRLDLAGDQSKSIVTFQTINKCKFVASE
ncbi:hypothetical protein [uncultured Cohaesibacter sp.]|uniref:hypothetical protein n=1 Tax=uncultured Cohaesibacter sp. TaxID=1002546 RepID=UPI002930290D|nr:hypothetical protein [uncultured Cohaesibacter sp.]